MERRRFLIHLAAGAIASSLPSCQYVQQASQTSVESAAAETAARTRLVMATAANYPPYEFTQTIDNETRIVGFDIDLGRAIADILGYPLEIVELAFEDLLPTLQAQAEAASELVSPAESPAESPIDFVMAGLRPTQRRQQLVDFSHIYYSVRHAVVVPQEWVQGDPTDLSYLRVGVIVPSAQAAFADRQVETTPGLTVVSFDNTATLVEALLAGSLDAILLDATVAQIATEQYAGLRAAFLTADQPLGAAIALPPNSALTRDINAALRELQATGKIAQLVGQWFGGL